MNHDELIKVAEQYRQDIIEARIARLEAQVAQVNASELHQRAEHLDRKLMYRSPMEAIALEGIPSTWDFEIGGDNEKTNGLIAELKAMRSEPELTIQFDAEAMIKGLAEAGKRLNSEMIGERRKEEEIPTTKAELLENPDMSPWASSTE